MRLTCPNCGAQYEVPDEVIPYDGRDVQCSNCGDTWFQGHPDNPDTAPEPEMVVPEPGSATRTPARPGAQPGPGDALDGSLDGSQEFPETRETGGPQPDTDTGSISGVTDILRQEAEREAQLRAADKGAPLESQPDLGLDNIVGDAPERRAQEARSRMARMRGEASEAETGVGPRRELLPDIEEINSAWSASDEGASSGSALGPVRPGQARPKRGGFTRGFALIVIIGVVMALLYVNAPKIARALPVAEPMLNSYVGLVDQARIWLDAQLGDMVPAPDE